MKQKLQKGDKIPYTQIANKVLNDTKLSFKAKGIYAYLYSKDDRYDFAAKRIRKDSSDGLDGVLAGLKELEYAGYLVRQKLKNGRVVYTIFLERDETLNGKIPTRENPNQGKSLKGKSRTITNLEGETNKDKKQTSPNPLKGGKEVSDYLMSSFEKKWDESGGDFEYLMENIGFMLKVGNETISRAPVMVRDFLRYHPNNGWATKEDFMATMKNMTGAIRRAGVERVSKEAWDDALERTAEMDMATIRTAINLI